MSDQKAPSVSEAGVIRVIRTEARGDEQQRILDLLQRAAQADEQAASRSDRPASTAQGRRAAGLRAAAELIETRQPTHVGEEWSAVGGLDSVATYHYDPPEEPDELPVRLVAWDNADDMVATVYLSLDEAEQHFRGGLELIEKLRRDRTQRTEA